MTNKIEKLNARFINNHNLQVQISSTESTDDICLVFKTICDTVDKLIDVCEFSEKVRIAMETRTKIAEIESRLDNHDDEIKELSEWDDDRISDLDDTNTKVEELEKYLSGLCGKVAKLESMQGLQGRKGSATIMDDPLASFVDIDPNLPFNEIYAKVKPMIEQFYQKIKRENDILKWSHEKNAELSKQSKSNTEALDKAPKKRCVEELTIKLNLDDESCQTIKDRVDAVVKENVRLKSENESFAEELNALKEEIKDLRLKLVCRNQVIRNLEYKQRHIRFTDMKDDKSYLVKSKKSGWFAGVATTFPGINSYDFDFVLNAASGTHRMNAHFKAEDIESIQELD